MEFPKFPVPVRIQVALKVRCRACNLEQPVPIVRGSTEVKCRNCGASLGTLKFEVITNKPN